MLKIALTHDIDRTKKTYQHISKPIRALLKGNIRECIKLLGTVLKRGNYWTFEDIVQIESRYNVKSTFFFLNESIKFNILRPKTFKLSFGRYNIFNPKIINLIKKLDNNGWEIGVHGSYNSYKNIELLKAEKNALESIVGHPIMGVRQHYLNLDYHTWSKQNEAGFSYDSSYGYTRSIGFKDNIFRPFHPLNNYFTVFPLVVMDFCFMETENRWQEFDRLLDICEKHDAILVINFHNDVFNMMEFNGYRDSYIKMIEKGIKRNCDFQTISTHFRNLNDDVILKQERFNTN